MRLFSYRNVQRDKIRRAENFFFRGERDAFLARELAHFHDVVAQNFAAERSQQPDQILADVAQANDANRAAGKLDAAFLVPFALLEQMLRERHMWPMPSMKPRTI